MNTLRQTMALLTILSLAHQGAVFAGTPVGTTISYQGQLKEAGVPMNGNVDLQFELFDAEVDGNRVGSPLLIEDVPIVKGLFSVELDFGAAAFTGDARWAQIEVRVPQDGGGTLVVQLSPRQPLTGTPYSMFALAPWEQTGTGISFTDGNVGIGTDIPANRLSVAGGADFGGNLGIRRSNPAASFDVKGTGDTSTTGTPIARFERGDGSNFLAVFGDAGGNYIVADAAGTGQKNLFLQTKNNRDIILEPHGSGKVSIRANAGGATQLNLDGFLNISQPDISGTVALRLDIGRLWVFRQFGSGAAGQLELASLNRSDGSISNKDFIFNTNGDVVIKGRLDIGYEIVSNTGDIPACTLCCNGSELFEDVIARCPSGKRVLGGGCTQPGGGLTPGCDPLLESYPTAEGDGWVCDVDAGTFAEATIKAWAICANIK